MSALGLIMKAPGPRLYNQLARPVSQLGARSIATVNGLKIRGLTEGETIPSLTFSFETSLSLAAEDSTLAKKNITTLKTADLFAGKRCVVFRDTLFNRNNNYPFLHYYEKRYDEIKALGIDEVFCASPNNMQVMRQWMLYNKCEEDPTPGSLGFKRVKPLPEGCRLFQSIGLDVWSDVMRFSVIQKFQRYAIVINDKKIEKVFKENAAESLPVAFKDANADKLLTYLSEIAASSSGDKTDAHVESHYYSMPTLASA